MDTERRMTVAEMGHDAFAAKCFIEYLCWALWACDNNMGSYCIEQFKFSYLWGKMGDIVYYSPGKNVRIEATF